MPNNHKKISGRPYLYLALPVLNESKRIERLLEVLKNQDYPYFKLFVCINQPDHWWQLPEKEHICTDNAATLHILGQCNDFPITLINRTSPGRGWIGKHNGVGWARKTAMDAINDVANPSDLIVSIDADTYYPPKYLSSLASNYSVNSEAAAFAIPYYHQLTDNERTNRAILRYEIYMRYYAINLWRCNIPYKFTAIGSAMASPVWAYRKIGGITPHQSGEDFYFIQKLSKTGTVVTWNAEKAYPAARFSNRVIFGTGPAMIKGDGGDWSAYPFYDPKQFEIIAQTFQQLDQAQQNTHNNPFISFLNKQLKTDDLFTPLRLTHTSPERFVKACIERIDALRILQYLRYTQAGCKTIGESVLSTYLKEYHQKMIAEPFSFDNSSIQEINILRNLLSNIESEYQTKEWNNQCKNLS